MEVGPLGTMASAPRLVGLELKADPGTALIPSPFMGVMPVPVVAKDHRPAILTRVRVRKSTLILLMYYQIVLWSPPSSNSS